MLSQNKIMIKSCMFIWPTFLYNLPLMVNLLNRISTAAGLAKTYENKVLLLYKDFTKIKTTFIQKNCSFSFQFLLISHMFLYIFSGKMKIDKKYC